MEQRWVLVAALVCCILVSRCSISQQQRTLSDYFGHLDCPTMKSEADADWKNKFCSNDVVANLMLNFTLCPDRRLIHVRFLSRFGHVIANLTNISDYYHTKTTPAPSQNNNNASTASSTEVEVSTESSLPLTITTPQSVTIMKELVFGDVTLTPFETRVPFTLDTCNYSFVAAKECIQPVNGSFCVLMPERNVITGVLRLDGNAILLPGQCQMQNCTSA